MIRPTLALPLFAAAMLALSFRPIPPEEVELDEVAVFIEFNSTDGDFGIQFFWDGDPWKRMRIFNSEGQRVLDITARANLGEHGLTEGFFESAEPSKDKLPMEEFFERFPEGEYEFEGRTLEGDALVGEADFTHVLPAAPENLFPNDGAKVLATSLLIATFDAVTQDLDGNPLEPALYEVVVESENEILRVFSATLEGDVKNPSVTVPPEFLLPGMEYKLEVIVQEEGGNRTISETEFATFP